MGLETQYTEEVTPIDEKEREGLKTSNITTKQELFELEHLNIQKAIEWTIKKKIKKEEIFTEKFVKHLHKLMYSDVWKWAGTYSLKDNKLGVDRYHIGVELMRLFNDALYWISKKSYSPDEIAIRFKHRLVLIHCFPSGNERHSRLIADIIIENVFNEKHFSWGRNIYSKADDIRKEYLLALKEADKGNYEPLTRFARQ